MDTEVVELIHCDRGKAQLGYLSHMQWIRAQEPMLFLLLTQVGQMVYSTECAGIIAHHMAETSAKRAIYEPMVEMACAASAT